MRTILHRIRNWASLNPLARLGFAAVAGAMVLKAADHAFTHAAWVRLGGHIGRISFSIYLWHLLVVIALAQLFDIPGRWSAWPAAPAIALYLVVATLATWAVSLASFALIERPYFERRKRTARVMRAEAP